MSKRKNYYEHVNHCDFKAFESKSDFDHDGPTININSVSQLEKLAMDYLSMKRGGVYYQAFEYTLKLIATLRTQSHAIAEIHRNTIV